MFRIPDPDDVSRQSETQDELWNSVCSLNIYPITTQVVYLSWTVFPDEELHVNKQKLKSVLICSTTSCGREHTVFDVPSET